jgi:hypothetical protein
MENNLVIKIEYRYIGTAETRSFFFAVPAGSITAG